MPRDQYERRAALFRLARVARFNRVGVSDGTLPLSADALALASAWHRAVVQSGVLPNEEFAATLADFAMGVQFAKEPLGDALADACSRAVAGGPVPEIIQGRPLVLVYHVCKAMATWHRGNPFNVPCETTAEMLGMGKSGASSVHKALFALIALGYQTLEERGKKRTPGKRAVPSLYRWKWKECLAPAETPAIP